MDLYPGVIVFVGLSANEFWGPTFGRLGGGGEHIIEILRVFLLFVPRTMRRKPHGNAYCTIMLTFD